MKQTVYIDVLICVNLFINYIILLAVSHFINIKVKTKRLLIGSAVGAMSSLIILLPSLGGILNILIKIILSVIMVFIVYGRSDIKRTAKLVAVLFLTTFTFCGIMLAIWYVAYPSGLTMRNSVIYINISPVMLIILTLICYLVITLINRVTGKNSRYKLTNRLEVTVNGKSVSLFAKYDTGNTLKEPFSGLPVIVADKELFNGIIELEDEKAVLMAKGRLIPFSSLGGTGMLPAVKPEKVSINGKLYDGECYVALCNKGMLSGGINALLCEELLS